MTTCYRIPQDLIIEILLRLPGKSVLKFKSVSKLWSCTISSQQFINAFMSMSLSRPHLFLGFNDRDDDQALFFSIPYQSCSFLEESPMLVAEKNTLKMPKAKSYIGYVCNSVRGLLCCCTMMDGLDVFTVCNPTTGQIITLDKYDFIDYFCLMYLGYDPNNDQYKVLRLVAPMSPPSRIEHSVCTLGGQISSHSWRPIKTNITHYDCSPNGVCINGVVYYEYKHCKICSFDIASELLCIIETPEDLKGHLTNYLGKLAVYYGFNLWVLDDVKNQFWSKKTYAVPSITKLSMFTSFEFVGITASGEIVYVGQPFSYPLEFLCYDAKKKMERRVRVNRLEHYIYEVDNRPTLKISPFYLSLSYVENIIYL